MEHGCGPGEQCDLEEAGGVQAVQAVERGKAGKARLSLEDCGRLLHPLKVILTLLLGSLQCAGVWEDHSVSSTEGGLEVNINEEGRLMDRGGKVRGMAVTICFFRLDPLLLLFPAGALRQRGWG